MFRSACVPFAAASLILASRASAQDVAPPLIAPSTKDQDQLATQVGGSWSTGNSKALQINASVRTSVRRGDDELTASGQISWGRATERPIDDPEEAPKREFELDSLYYARLRYDRFFLERNSFYVAALAFSDSASGFKSRLGPYAGYRRILAAGDRLSLYVDGGYRLYREVLDLDRKARQDGLPERRWVHGPTLGTGVDVHLKETLELDIYGEAQADVGETRGLRGVGIIGLTNKIGDAFALGMNLNVRWLQRPIGDRQGLDTQLQVVAIGDWSSAK